MNWQSWYQTKRGRALARQEMVILHELMSYCHGSHLLLMGPVELTTLMEKAIIANQTYVPPNYDDLPNLLKTCAFFPNRLDVAILHHVIDSHENWEEILLIISKILIPNGRMLLTFIRPTSLLGWRKWVDNLPWRNECFLATRVRRVLIELGFALESWQVIDADLILMVRKKVRGMHPLVEESLEILNPKQAILPTQRVQDNYEEA